MKPAPENLTLGQALAEMKTALTTARHAMAQADAMGEKIQKRWGGQIGPAGEEESEMYDVIKNGRYQSLPAAQVEELRETWKGGLLLDLPKRTLRIRSSSSVAPRLVDLTTLGWGPKKTLLVGLARPGRSFYGGMAVHVLNRNIELPSVRVLSRYVCQLRALMADDARQPRNIFRQRLDRPGSGPKWGYVIPKEITCLVIDEETQ